jgi:hypothetical protein
LPDSPNPLSGDVLSTHSTRQDHICQAPPHRRIRARLQPCASVSPFLLRIICREACVLTCVRLCSYHWR